MNKIVSLFIAVMFLVAGACFAQEVGQQKGPGMQNMQEMQQRAEEMLKARLDKLTKDLSLTMDQVSGLKDVLNDYGQQMRQIMKETQEKMRGLHLKEKESIKALLTPEQKTKFESMKERLAPTQAPDSMSAP